jgi:hypothetical protein
MLSGSGLRTFAFGITAAPEFLPSAALQCKPLKVAYRTATAAAQKPSDRVPAIESSASAGWVLTTEIASSFLLEAKATDLRRKNTRQATPCWKVAATHRGNLRSKLHQRV